MAYNFPDAPANGDIIQTAGRRFEWDGTQTRWEYRGLAQFAGGTPVVEGTNTWTSATGTTLTSTDCVQLSLDNSTWSQSAAVTAGGTYYTRWDPGATCLGAAHGTTITGTITDSTDGATQNYSLTLDKLPDAFTFSPATATVPASTVTSTIQATSFTVAGINAPTPIWAVLTTTSGGTAPSTAEYSLDGGITWVALSTTPGANTVENGDTVNVRFTTGDTTNTTDTLTLSIGDTLSNKVDGTFTVTVGKPAFANVTNFPTIADGTTTASTTWANGATTINGTGCIEFSVDGGITFTQAATAITDGTNLLTRWKAGTGVGTTCADAPHGTTITGSIENATNADNATLLIDRVPAAFTVVDQTGIALNTATNSASFTISGTNATTYLQFTGDATNPLTTPQASINTGAFAAIPAAATYTLAVPPGASIIVQGTTGAAITTAYLGDVIMGDAVANAQDNWSVTTAAAVPTISQPSITAPADDATGITTSPTETSSAYTGVNSPGPHTCSDWELYRDSAPITSTNTITAVTVNPGGTWVLQTSSFAVGEDIFGVTYGGGQFVAVGDFGKLATSSDGINWTQQTSSFGTTLIKDITYGSGQYVAVGADGKIATSPDGINWTQRTNTFNSLNTITDVAYDGSGQYVAVALFGRLATSPDGITWTQQTSGFGTTNIQAITYGGGQWVAVGENGKLATSSDGITWTLRTSSFGTTDIEGVAYDGSGKFVAVGRSGKLATSSDGITWTQQTSSFTGAIYNVNYGGGQWVAVGGSGKIATSPDGVTWTQQTSNWGNIDEIFNVAYGGGQWVIVGKDGKIATEETANTVITIAGAQTDGFEVGWQIDDCGGGAGPGTITSLDDTQVTLAGSPTGFAVGENICAAGSVAVQTVTCSTTDLTSWTPTGPLNSGSNYYTRVRYKDDSSTGTLVISPWSAWSKYTTA